MSGVEKIWRENLERCDRLVADGAGPGHVTIVTGGAADAAFWRSRSERTRRTVFGVSGATRLTAVSEGRPMGNFLGTLNAWRAAREAGFGEGRARDDGGGSEVSLLTMVVGRGTRLSPFTQALGGRKPAFPTARRCEHSGLYLNIAEVSNLCSLLWVAHLRESGFQGVVVKWGDEALVPGIAWSADPSLYREADVVRFGWEASATPELAAQKEWLVCARESGGALEVRRELARRELPLLRRRFETLGSDVRTFVNLGSFAIGFALLEVLGEVFGDDLARPDRAADWDPYFWVALLAADEAEWRAERDREEREGRTGIGRLEASYPDFFAKVRRVRKTAEDRLGRALKTVMLDFGSTFWVDMGSQLALREHLQSLHADTASGRTARALYRLGEPDQLGNVVRESTIEPAASVRRSTVVGARIRGAGSVLEDATVIGGEYGTLEMERGGAVLFSVAKRLRVDEASGIAFRSIGEEVEVAPGGRHTTLALPDGLLDLAGSEKLETYAGEGYEEPILGNPISFAEAERRVAAAEPDELDQRWEEAAARARSRIGGAWP